MTADVLVGIDVGGTFSDVIAVSPEPRILTAFKVSSTPGDPATAVLTGLRRLVDELPGAAEDRTMHLYHGTTVATNALIQRSGACTALLTTAGCRDVLALRRQARPDLYRLDQRISRPLVAAQLRFEVNERLGPDGRVLADLQPDDLANVVERLREAGVESVAVCFLHSYANPEHERLAASVLRERLPGLDVSVSADICPELGEFERTSTAVVNAYVSPAVRGYLRQLQRGAAEYGIDEFSVVKSNGGLSSAANAERFPVHLIESGPAAGLSGVAELGRQLGVADLVAFDMGGTTAKIGVIQGGEPRLARQLYADRYVQGEDHGGYVITSPVLDLAEIGAGGGSIAWLDRAGVLKVGPRSAGADPGPACYGLGSDEPTVTDAHLVVGNLGTASDAVPGGLDRARARDAVRKHIAEPLGWTVEYAAHAVLRLATATMAETVRLVTIRRGLDIRDFTLVAYGGAGPLHAADIAAEVGISSIVVPDYPAVFSALGAVLCDVRHDLVQTMLHELATLTPARLEAVFDTLTQRARTLLASESVTGEPQLIRRLDLRYEGQLHHLDVRVDTGATPAAIAAQFHSAYQQQYGYTLPDSAVELVNARLEVLVPRWPSGTVPAGTPVTQDGEDVRTVVDPHGTTTRVPVLTRGQLFAAGRITGPAFVVDPGTVTPVRATQWARPLRDGAFVVEGIRHA